MIVPLAASPVIFSPFKVSADIANWEGVADLPPLFACNGTFHGYHGMLRHGGLTSLVFSGTMGGFEADAGQHSARLAVAFEDVDWRVDWLDRGSSAVRGRAGRFRWLSCTVGQACIQLLRQAMNDDSLLAPWLLSRRCHCVVRCSLPNHLQYWICLSPHA